MRWNCERPLLCSVHVTNVCILFIGVSTQLLLVGHEAREMQIMYCLLTCEPVVGIKYAVHFILSANRCGNNFNLQCPLVDQTM